MFRLFVIALIFYGSITQAQDLGNGVIAHAMGKYDEALQIMLPLAKTSGDPMAQYYIGHMYELGQGVKQDHKKAAKWYRQAAEQSVPQAQFRLGELYANGKGIAQDHEYAYAWFSVAAASGHPQASTSAERQKEKLSSEESAEAEKLSSEYIERYVKESPPQPAVE